MENPRGAGFRPPRGLSYSQEGKANSSVLAHQADVARLEPRRRDRPARRFLDEVPRPDALLARFPREESAAVVDDGGEPDAAGVGVEQGEPQVLQFIQGAAQVLFGYRY